MKILVPEMILTFLNLLPMRIGSLFLVLWLTLAACQKEEEPSLLTSVIGRVDRLSAGEPINGAEIFLGWEKKSEPGKWIIAPKPCAMSDDKGMFAFTYQGRKEYNNRVYARKPPYREVNNFKDITPGPIRQGADITLTARGLGKIHIINENPNPEDSLNLTIYSNPTNYQLALLGSVDTTFTIEGWCDDYIPIWWYHYYKGRRQDMKLEMIVLNPYDTTGYMLKY